MNINPVQRKNKQTKKTQLELEWREMQFIRHLLLKYSCSPGGQHSSWLYVL